MTESRELEAPSGKDAAGENFPVGSILLPARLRPHVAAFYEFARAADDIADNARMDAEEKLARLSRIEEALQGGCPDDAGLAKAHRIRDSLTATGVPARHCLDLLEAFRQDVKKHRYADWADLIDYCNRSAAPVGRFLLDLHGEERRLWPASDSLCNALQVLNHLQDCGEDYREMDRVYIPEPWLMDEGINVEALAEQESSPALRRVLDRMLEGVGLLLEEASPLAGKMQNRRLAIETAVIHAIARRLAAELRRRDPLAERVKLSRVQYFQCIVRGVFRGFGPMAVREDAKAEIRRIVAGTGTSFYWAMRLLPAARREAMFAVYAFCREVDDIADGDLPTAEKRARLGEWRSEIARIYDGAPESAIGRALGAAARDYGLEREDMEAVVAGVEMDATGDSQAPDMATLNTYCERVAGAVGLLSIKIFGDDSVPARRGAIALGHALQLTNILRDVAEDAARGRLYLPRELLMEHGIHTTDPATVASHPAVGEVCAALAADAESSFLEASEAFAACDRRALRPAFAMMDLYRTLLHRMKSRGWSRLDRRPRIGTLSKLWIAARNMLPT